MNGGREVQLHLLRHAHAGDPLKWNGPDAARPLSEKGRRRPKGWGLLAAAGFRLPPTRSSSSPKLRALDTARLVATPLGLPVVVVDALAASLISEPWTSCSPGPAIRRRPLLVGHDPDFSELAADLIGAPELDVRKGALVRIDAARPLRAGGGVLRWLVPPELLSPD